MFRYFSYFLFLKFQQKVKTGSHWFRSRKWNEHKKDFLLQKNREDNQELSQIWVQGVKTANFQ